MPFYYSLFNDPSPTEIYTLSLHDALPISPQQCRVSFETLVQGNSLFYTSPEVLRINNACFKLKFYDKVTLDEVLLSDRKSTRLNSSHSQISYAVFCLKKKKRKLPYKLTTH